MYIVLTVLACTALGFYLNRLYLTETFKKLFLLSFAFHLISGMAVWFLYQYHYQNGDILFYIKDLQSVWLKFSHSPTEYFQFLYSDNNSLLPLINQQERSLFFIKCISILHFISNGNIVLTQLFLSILSFVACWLCIKKLNTCFPNHELTFIISFSFIPSVLFWGSGLVKETVTLIFIYIIIICALHLSFSKRKKQIHLFFLLLSGFMLFELRYFVFAIFFSFVLLLLLFHFVKSSHHKKKIAIGSTLLLIITVISISFLHPNLHINNIIDVIIHNHKSVVDLSQPGDFMVFPQLDVDHWRLFLYLPFASFFGILRPFLWESTNVLQFLSSLENTVFLLLIFYQIRRLPTLWKNANVKYWFILSIGYALSMSAVLAISTPNYGSLNRYRIVFLPFLVFWLLYQNPILNKWQKKMVKTA
ncbi:MAG: hypothetical protein O9340_12765 [Cyclobacteriaceae bacterium]|jgi:hypothetical protein|nr:hypothetical protein [Cyclobacteriaceae bacterium]